jgi:hypothetical protein
MRIYTVDRYGINHFVKVENRFLPDGTKIPAFILGEEGRGRKLVFVPVFLTDKSLPYWEANGWVAVNAVSYRVNSKGYVHLWELDKPTEEGEYLIVFLGWIGFRGSNSLTDIDGNALGRDVVLAEGRIAEGIAGRMGAGSQWLLKVRVGDVYRYRVDGRLYGEPHSYILLCSSKGPVLYDEETWDAVQEYKA